MQEAPLARHLGFLYKPVASSIIRRGRHERFANHTPGKNCRVKSSVVGRVKREEPPWTPVRCLTFETVALRPPRRRLAPAAGMSRGEAATMVDVTAGQGAGSAERLSQPRRNRQHPEARRHRAGVRHPHHPGGADPAAALDRARPVSGDLDHAVDPDPDDVAVHPGAAGILRVPDRPADLDHAAAVAQPRLDAADPVARP